VTKDCCRVFLQLPLSLLRTAVNHPMVCTVLSLSIIRICFDVLYMYSTLFIDKQSYLILGLD